MILRVWLTCAREFHPSFYGRKIGCAMQSSSIATHLILGHNVMPHTWVKPRAGNLDLWHAKFRVILGSSSKYCMRNRETLVNWTLWSLIFLAAPRAPSAIISQEKLWVYRGGENENCLMAEVRVPIFHASYFFYDFKMREFWREFQFSQEFLSIWNYAQWMKKLPLLLTRSLVNQNPWWDKSGIQWHQRKLSWKNCKFLRISFSLAIARQATALDIFA